MIDEEAARKDNFDAANSVVVAFAGGVEMALPKPFLEIRPVFQNGKAIANYSHLTYGPAIEALLDAIRECEYRREELVAVASLAAYLLCWHYDLSDAELDELLCYRVGDDASQEWVDHVIEVATGTSGPKVGRAGGG
jgi:hypothetical protein